MLFCEDLGRCHESGIEACLDHSDDGIVRGWRSVHISDGDQPYMDKWWVPGLNIGYEHTFVHQVADFIRSIDEGTPCSPTFREAQETQQVCEAVLESAKGQPGKTTRLELTRNRNGDRTETLRAALCDEFLGAVYIGECDLDIALV